MMVLRLVFPLIVAIAMLLPITQPESPPAGRRADAAAQLEPVRAARYQIAIPAVLPERGGIYLGIWQPGFPDSSRLVGIEPQKRPAIVSYFQSWDDLTNRPNLESLRRVQAQGSVVLVTWEPWRPGSGRDQPEFRLSVLAAGRFDDYVRAWARDLAAHPGPVLLRFAHEMNLTVYPWARSMGNTPDQYRQVWRRYRAIFAEEGATNVRWVWSPGLTWSAETAIEPYFPGDDVVDWVATSGYNYPPWGGWQPFRTLFGPTINRLAAVSTRPIMIAEVGSVEFGGNKAEWIRSAFQEEVFAFPRLRAVIWFNEIDPVNGADWRIDSSATARRAFDESVASPTYLSRWSD